MCVYVRIIKSKHFGILQQWKADVFPCWTNWFRHLRRSAKRRMLADHSELARSCAAFVGVREANEARSVALFSARATILSNRILRLFVSNFFFLPLFACLIRVFSQMFDF